MAFELKYPFCSLLLLLLSFSTTAQRYSNISLGSSLTALNDNRSWASPSGDFAFGFQQIEKDGFLLAIWFNKIPERTIVWSANRNKLVQRKSKVELTTDGLLVLTDAAGERVWNSASTGTGASYAAMLDSGNFVLAKNDSINLLWESFNYPTDTILPTQTLNRDSQLIARYTETNYSSGRFKFILQPDGILVLYTTAFPKETVDSSDSAYWIAPTPTGSGFQVIFNQSGYIYLVASNGSILSEVLSEAESTEDFYQRAILDYDGIFRQDVYPKNAIARANKWPMAWSTLSYIPSNICLSKIRGTTGGGACGFNSYCTLADDGRPNCQCPPDYHFLDPDDERKGCTQSFTPQRCNEASPETDLFEFRVMPNTDWPRSDYEHFTEVNEDWCRQACLSDCFCSAAIFRNRECWKKKIPLSNGRTDSSTGGRALIKVRKDNSTSSEASPTKKRDQSITIRIGSVLLGSSVFLNLLLVGATFLFFYRVKQSKKKAVLPHEAMPAMNIRSFTFDELEEATGGFKEELGKGASGTVYKGVLAFENREFVAVKKLEKVMTEGEKEFQAEVRAISRTNHKNLVQLLGFCNKGQHRLLVYQHMTNGSLANFLFGDSRPNWYKRVQIAFGIARGLFYLHEECSFQIIHCDIKPQNILLDDFLTARISDFGLAKLLRTDQTRTNTAIRGTKGYVAPEWFKSMPITVKVDVYSFGVLLLELICCRKNFELDLEDENQMILADWAYDCYKEGTLDLLLQNDDEATDDIKRVEKFVMIAIWCIQEDPSLRPTMKKVTQMMEGTVEVSVPPDPNSFISSV